MSELYWRHWYEDKKTWRQNWCGENMSILQLLSVIPDKLEVEDLIELLNIINEAAF